MQAYLRKKSLILKFPRYSEVFLQIDEEENVLKSLGLKSRCRALHSYLSFFEAERLKESLSETDPYLGRE